MSIRDVTVEKRLEELKRKLKELGVSEEEIESIIRKIRDEELTVRSIRTVNDCAYVGDVTVIKSLVYEREWILPLYGEMSKETISEYQDEYGRTEVFKICTETPVSVIYHNLYSENSGRVEANIKEIVILRKAN